MSLPLGILVILVIAGVILHTMSYAVWNWKQGNRAGFVFLCVLCLATLVMPLYLFFFRT
jgi:hypothetical protein